MTALSFDWATIQVLWRRDMKRFWRQPSRLVGALGQPIIFWGVIGLFLMVSIWGILHILQDTLFPTQSPTGGASC